AAGTLFNSKLVRPSRPLMNSAQFVNDIQVPSARRSAKFETRKSSRVTETCWPAAVRLVIKSNASGSPANRGAIFTRSVAAEIGRLSAHAPTKHEIQTTRCRAVLQPVLKLG